MCGELQRDWLGDDMTDPVEKREAALHDIGRGMEWARSRQGLWDALAGLFEEARELIPNSAKKTDGEREARRDADLRVYRLIMPSSSSRDARHRLCLNIESFGEAGDVECSIRKTLGQSEVKFSLEEEDVPMLLPLVRHCILEFIDAWIREAKQRAIPQRSIRKIAPDAFAYPNGRSERQSVEVSPWTRRPT